MWRDRLSLPRMHRVLGFHSHFFASVIRPSMQIPHGRTLTAIALTLHAAPLHKGCSAFGRVGVPPVIIRAANSASPRPNVMMSGDDSIARCVVSGWSDDIVVGSSSSASPRRRRPCDKADHPRLVISWKPSSRGRWNTRATWTRSTACAADRARARGRSWTRYTRGGFAISTMPRRRGGERSSRSTVGPLPAGERSRTDSIALEGGAYAFLFDFVGVTKGQLDTM